MTTEQIYQVAEEGANMGRIVLPEEFADPAIILRALRDHAKDMAEWMEDPTLLYMAYAQEGCIGIRLNNAEVFTATYQMHHIRSGGQDAVEGEENVIGQALSPEGVVWLLRLHRSNAVEGLVQGKRRVVGLACADTLDFTAIHQAADHVLRLSRMYPSEAKRFLNPSKD